MRRKIPVGARDEICASYRRGKTLQEIGDVYGVSRERIRQMLRRWGVDSDTGGIHLRAVVAASSARSDVIQRRNARIARLESYCGCCHDEILRICGGVNPWSARQYGHVKNPGAAYITQRENAKKRGIQWNLSLSDWWRIWQESGKWEQRGRGKGNYVMARWGDTGPYSVDNVYITEASQNCVDYYAVPENKSDWFRKMKLAQPKARFAA